jgi:hypothetical protein
MKKNLIRFVSIAMAAMASLALIFSLNSCESDSSDDDPSPEITWASNPDFEIVQITDSMDVNLTVTSPIGINGFVIKVTSPDDAFTALLDNFVSEANKSANNDGVVVLDLIYDVKTVAALGLIGIPTGINIQNQTEVSLSLSNLIPLIKNVATTEGDYVFEATVTDLNGKSDTKEPTFHLSL